MVMTVVASWPESRAATMSLSATRLPISPAYRCEKNCTGRRSTCQRNLLDVVTESLTCRRSR